MVNIEDLIINGERFTKTYSDKGFKIRKVGTDEIYDEAIDIDGAGFEYEETNIVIDVDKKEVE